MGVPDTMCNFGITSPTEDVFGDDTVDPVIVWTLIEQGTAARQVNSSLLNKLRLIWGLEDTITRVTTRRTVCISYLADYMQGYDWWKRAVRK